MQMSYYLEICYYFIMETAYIDKRQNPLSPFNLIHKVWHFIPGYTKIQFCSAFIIGLLIHFYIMVNGFINHDSVLITEYYNWAHALSGRWFSIVPDMISSSFNLIWITSLLAIFYVSISTCLIGACLEIRRTPLVLLLSGIVVSFPSMAGWLSYRISSDIAIFSVLLACLAIFLAKYYKFGFLFGVIPLLFSLASYQAYFGFFAGTMALILMRDLICNQKIKTVLMSALKYLSTLFLGLIAYVITLNLPFYGGLTSYKDIDTFGGFTLQNLPERFMFSYTNFFDVFIRNSLKLHQDYMQDGRIYQFLFVIAAIAALILLLCIILNKKIYQDKIRLVLLLISIALLPPTCNAISILSPNNLYILMQYSLVLFFAFLLILVDISVNTSETCPSLSRSNVVSLSSWFLMILCLLITINYAIYANIFYSKLELVNKQGQLFSTALVTKIQSEDFYTVDKPIVLFGEAPQSFAYGYFENIYAIPLGDIPNMYSYPAYLLIYYDLRNPISKNFLPPELSENEASVEAINNMPTYPTYGSIAEVDGFIVVKFSTEASQ